MTEQQAEIEEQQESNISPGQSLRQAREAAGLTQQALADKIFLKVNVIQEMEADEVNPKTSTTFTKGYIRLYAKHVGIDPEPLLIEFDRLYAVDKPPQKLQSFSKRVSTEANDHRWMMVTYGILAVVIALVVIWWYQQPPSTDVTANTASTNYANEVEQATTEITPQSQPVEVTGQPSNATGLDVLASDVAMPEQVELESDSASLPATVETETSDAAEIETAVTQTSTDSVELVFTFADDCWVNIVDATGEAIAYGVKVKGRVMPVTGMPPFSVTLGAPQVVTIAYAGESVDLSALPAGQIARFELPMQE